jgi:hypothetical protein
MRTHATVLGPMALLAGLAFAACGESSEGSGGTGGEAPEPECVDGATRQAACGLNDRGTLEERCVDGAWEALACEDPDECVDDVVDRTNFCDRRCEAGAWVDVPCAPVQVSVGAEQACAVLSSGRVACWGEGLTPTMLEDVHDVVQVAVTGGPVCTLHADGAVRCVGEDWDKCASHGGCTEISEGLCMLTEAREVWCQGWVGSDGPWGDGHSVVALVRGLHDPVAVRSSRREDCAIDALGGVWCWSQVVGGEGWGVPAYFDAVEVPDLEQVIDFSAGCAVLASGDVVCDYPAPDGVPSSSQIAAGTFHSCALSLAGEVWCWGDNSAGQLGQGHTDPVGGAARVVGLEQVVEIDAVASRGWLCDFPDTIESKTTCALRESGEVWCWGNNFGVCGKANPLPVRVPLPGGR